MLHFPLPSYQSTLIMNFWFGWVERVSCWIFSLQLKCKILQQRAGEVCSSQMQIPSRVSCTSCPFRKMTKIPLTFPPVHKPQGYSTSHPCGMHWQCSKKIQSPVFNNPPALFQVLPLIRAPLPTRILQTVGTLSYNCILHVVHSLVSKSSLICGHWWSYAQ